MRGVSDITIQFIDCVDTTPSILLVVGIVNDSMVVAGRSRLRSGKGSTESTWVARVSSKLSENMLSMARLFAVEMCTSVIIVSMVCWALLMPSLEQVGAHTSIENAVDVGAGEVMWGV